MNVLAKAGALLITLGMFVAPTGSAVAATCLGRDVTIVVGSGRVEARGTSSADVIIARNGNQTIDGGGGNDRICAGGGDDRILGGEGSDRVDAGGGDDTVEGGNGSDRLSGGGGVDTIFGNRGNDRIDAGAGSDLAEAGLGDDFVSGGAGSHDRVVGGVGNDRLRGGAGDEDVLRGDHGADLFNGGAGAHDTASFAVSGFDGPILGGQGVIVDLTTGQASQDGTDRLTGVEDVIGTSFNDSLRGNSSENSLYGNGGDDHLQGVGPRDRALGGAGSDVCEEVDQTDSCGPEARPSGFSVEVAVGGGGIGGSLTVISRDPPYVPGSTIGSLQSNTSVEVGFEAGEWTVTGGPQLLPSEGCVMLGAEVRCPAAAEPDAVLVTGNAGDDRLALRKSVPPSVEGSYRATPARTSCSEVEATTASTEVGNSAVPTPTSSSLAPAMTLSIMERCFSAAEVRTCSLPVPVRVNASRGDPASTAFRSPAPIWGWECRSDWAAAPSFQLTS